MFICLCPLTPTVIQLKEDLIIKTLLDQNNACISHAISQFRFGLKYELDRKLRTLISIANEEVKHSSLGRMHIPIKTFQVLRIEKF